VKKPLLIVLLCLFLACVFLDVLLSVPLWDNPLLFTVCICGLAASIIGTVFFAVVAVKTVRLLRKTG
jgi:hypothetical protein